MHKSAPIVFDHVACGVRRTDDLAMLLEGELGAQPYRRGPGGGFRAAQWSFEAGGKLELLAPDGAPGGFLHRYIDSHGPGIHHVTFKVPDIHAARDRATELGYDVVGFRDDQPAWKECFLHPKQAGGIVVQMAEVDPDFEEEDWLPFPSAYRGEPVRRVRLHGPRLVSRDRLRSHRCWVELLGARCETGTVAGGPSQELFGWDGSPLRIRVVYDAGAAVEGPVGLEVSRLASPLPELLPALLGTDLLSI